MRLTLEHLTEWAEVTEAGSPGQAEFIKALEARAADPDWLARRFVAIEGGRVVGTTWLVPIGADRWLIAAPRTRSDSPIDAPTAGLVDEAVQELRDRSAVSLEARIPIDRLSPPLDDALVRTGATRASDRIEYKTPLSDLPEHAPGPLRWRSASSEGLDDAARLLSAVATGPDGLEADEDPRQWIDALLQTPDRINDPAACIHLGSLDNTDVALVCAQTETATGWSTIAYMGLRPEVRGRGLGNWVHRHGISMLRRQGAQLYHGGTGADNAAMQACFARQQCTPHMQFAVFRWSAPAL